MSSSRSWPRFNFRCSGPFLRWVLSVGLELERGPSARQRRNGALQGDTCRHSELRLFYRTSNAHIHSETSGFEFCGEAPEFGPSCIRLSL